MVLLTYFESKASHYREIGDEFVLTDHEANKEAFAEALKIVFGEGNEQMKQDCHCILTYQSGAKQIPFYRGHIHYLLNENGGLFKDLTVS